MRKIEVNIDLRPRIRNLEIATRYLTSTRLMGEYPSVFKGNGIEFADYRQYQASDDAGLIDWRASKRVGQLLVREYLEDRNINVLFLVDSSASMIFGSHDRLKHEYAAELTAAMAISTLLKGDSVGLIMFNDKVTARVPHQVGTQQAYHIYRNLANPVNYGGKCDFSKALMETSNQLETQSVLILVSDFIGLTEGDKRFLRIAAKKYDLIAVMVRDPRDNELPAGMHLVAIVDPYGGKQLVIDVGKVRERFNAEARKEMLELEDFFNRNGIDHLILDSSKPFVVPMVKFLGRRKDKWR